MFVFVSSSLEVASRRDDVWYLTSSVLRGLQSCFVAKQEGGRISPDNAASRQIFLPFSSDTLQEILASITAA